MQIERTTNSSGEQSAQMLNDIILAFDQVIRIQKTLAHRHTNKHTHRVTHRHTHTHAYTHTHTHTHQPTHSKNTHTDTYAHRQTDRLTLPVYLHQVLEENQYRFIEKIKTISSIYMVAIGLKPDSLILVSVCVWGVGV